MILSLLLSGALAAPPLPPEPQVREWLHSSADGREQTRMERWGEHGLTSQMVPADPSGHRPPEGPLIVAQKGDRWRLAYYADPIRVLVSVDVQDVGRVLNQPVVLQRKFLGKDDDGLVLGPGIRVEQGDPQDGWVPVKVLDERISAEGWLPWTVVDKAFTPAPVEQPDRDFADEPRLCLKERTQVHTKPKDKSRVLATAGPWAPNCPRKVIRLSVDTDGWAHVWWTDHDLSVKGYVPVSALEDPPRSLENPCAVENPGAWCDDPDPDFAISGGTWLYDRPNGAAVGIAMKDTALITHQPGKGWVGVKTRSPWGWLVLWVPPDL